MRIRFRWIILGTLGFLLLAYGVNMFVLNVIIGKPETAFKTCFGFSLPEGAVIVTSGVRRPINQRRPGFAFEIVLSENQYLEMMTGLQNYVERNGYSIQDWSNSKLAFFHLAKAEFWTMDWKEMNPQEIISYFETGYDVGRDNTKKIHLLFLMFTKEADGTYRMYSLTT